MLAARDEGTRRVIFASSSSVYGASPALPAREDMPTRPISPYSIAKLAAENYCRSFHGVYGLETVALRYFNVFGPRQDPGSQYSAVIPLFITAALHGRPVTIYGDGSHSRDFTYIDNVVDANLRAADAEGVSGGVYNVACGQRTSLNELAQRIGQLVGVAQSPPIYEARRQGDVPHSLADISAAARDLGFRPIVSVADGLARTIEHYGGEMSPT